MSYIELIENHTQELIQEINKRKEIPKSRKIRFSDGVSMCDFYRTILEIGHRGKFISKKFTNEELDRLKNCLQDIKDTLGKYNTSSIEYQDIKDSIKKKHDAYVANVCNVKNLISPSYYDINNTLDVCTVEVIKLIYELKRLPKYNEFTLSNGVDSRRFISTIYNTYIKNSNVDKKTKVDEIAGMGISLIKINKALIDTNNKEYTGEMTDKEKVEDMIESILSNNRLPYDEYFDDGIGKMNFYKSIKNKSSRIQLKGMMFPEDEDTVEYWEELEWMRLFVKYRRYYIKYHDRYLTRSEDISLKEWYVEQVENYYIEDKSDKQLKRESLLSDMCKNWMGNSVYQLDIKEKTLHL